MCVNLVWSVEGLIEQVDWPPGAEGVLQQTALHLHLHCQLSESPPAGLRTGAASEIVSLQAAASGLHLVHHGSSSIFSMLAHIVCFGLPNLQYACEPIPCNKSVYIEIGCLSGEPHLMNVQLMYAYIYLYLSLLSLAVKYVSNTALSCYHQCFIFCSHSFLMLDFCLFWCLYHRIPHILQ